MTTHRSLRALGAALVLLAAGASTSGAQAAPAAAPAASAQERAAARHADSLAVLALADTALARITRRDFAGLTDLMVPEAIIGTVSERTGRAGLRVRTREQERASTFTGTIVERGFGAHAMVSGPLAMVWMPYDIYVNGAWSHCGVDLFTMTRVAGDWRIATLIYSVEQPPACLPHPDGPPR